MLVGSNLVMSRRQNNKNVNCLFVLIPNKHNKQINSILNERKVNLFNLQVHRASNFYISSL